MAAISPETLQDIAERGQALYDAHIKPFVEENNKGKFLVLDVDTGEYEMDADQAQVFARMKEKRPQAIQYLVRVGYKAAHTMGWRGTYKLLHR